MGRRKKEEVVAVEETEVVEEAIPPQPKLEAPPLVKEELPAAEETVEEEKEKTFPRIRLKVEEEADKAKQFATAKGLSMYLQLSKAKKTGLTAAHKVVSWLSPKKKKK